jgi:hypothetical protein
LAPGLVITQEGVSLALFIKTFQRKYHFVIDFNSGTVLIDDKISESTNRPPTGGPFVYSWTASEWKNSKVTPSPVDPQLINRCYKNVQPSDSCTIYQLPLKQIFFILLSFYLNPFTLRYKQHHCNL